MTSMDRSTWNPAKPHVLPRPTYWPAALALGNTLLLWGILTTWIISALGAALCILSVAGWVHELLATPNEGTSDDQSASDPGQTQHRVG